LLDEDEAKVEELHKRFSKRLKSFKIKEFGKEGIQMHKI